ncbi:MAG: PAS sensor domain-containing protein [Sulfurospirillum sp.]|nr:MAG: PAS sensor domain-containing protein [Sulfurospirillum sp.]
MALKEHEYKLDRKTIIVSETDAKGNIVYANEDFCKISKFTKDELIGQPHSMVRHPGMPKAFFEDLWHTLKSGQTWSGVVKNRTKDGGYYWVFTTVYPSKTPEGETKYFSVRVKPTTDEIEKAEKLYATLA